MTKAPTFKLFECVGDPSSAILRFSSGPPYEDVAFKIRNEEWDTDRSHGYKTQFQARAPFFILLYMSICHLVLSSERHPPGMVPLQETPISAVDDRQGLTMAVCDSFC